MEQMEGIMKNDLAVNRKTRPMGNLLNTARIFTVVIIGATVLGPNGAWAQIADSQQSTSRQLLHAMRDVPAGYAVPMYPVGDVDENGTVDQKDWQLIKALARSGEDAWERITDASCPGAADINMDGTVSEEDATLLTELTADGTIAAPALFYQAALPCRFERLTVAVELFALSGEEVPVWVLRPGFSHRNTQVTVDSGPAAVRQSDNDRVYVVDVAPEAKTDDIILLKIQFEPDEEYWLSLPVQSAADGGPGDP